MNNNDTASDHDTAALESRLEASRRALRERLHPTDRDAGQAGEARAAGQQTSWISLFDDMLLPALNQFAWRHPVALLAGSALSGALLVWTRPWRGVLGSMLLANAVRKVSYIASSQSAPRLFQYWMTRRKPSVRRHTGPPAQP